MVYRVETYVLNGDDWNHQKHFNRYYRELISAIEDITEEHNNTTGERILCPRAEGKNRVAEKLISPTMDLIKARLNRSGQITFYVVTRNGEECTGTKLVMTERTFEDE